MSPEIFQYIWRKTISHIEVGMGSGSRLTGCLLCSVTYLIKPFSIHSYSLLFVPSAIDSVSFAIDMDWICK